MSAAQAIPPPHRHRSVEARSPAALAAVAALHVGALWGLMQIESFRAAVSEAVPIMVGLITPPAPDAATPPPPPPPKVEPKPKPKMIVAQGPPVPDPVTVPEEPEPIEEAPPPPPSPSPGEIAPPPVVPPSFVAAYLSNPPPDYPSTSKRLREQGRVLVRVHVSRDGHPLSVALEKGSGFERLDRAALDAVRRWKFVPARQGDDAIEAAVLVPLDFALTGG